MFRWYILLISLFASFSGDSTPNSFSSLPAANPRGRTGYQRQLPCPSPARLWYLSLLQSGCPQVWILQCRPRCRGAHPVRPAVARGNAYRLIKACSALRCQHACQVPAKAQARCRYRAPGCGVDVLVPPGVFQAGQVADSSLAADRSKHVAKAVRSARRKGSSPTQPDTGRWVSRPAKQITGYSKLTNCSKVHSSGGRTSPGTEVRRQSRLQSCSECWWSCK